MDILFLPNRFTDKPALLIELKWDKSAEKAITQIKEKNYTQLVKKLGYDGEVLLVGINYSTKTKKHSLSKRSSLKTLGTKDLFSL